MRRWYEERGGKSSCLLLDLMNCTIESSNLRRLMRSRGLSRAAVRAGSMGQSFSVDVMAIALAGDRAEGTSSAKSYGPSLSLTLVVPGSRVSWKPSLWHHSRHETMVCDHPTTTTASYITQIPSLTSWSLAISGARSPLVSQESSSEAMRRERTERWW